MQVKSSIGSLFSYLKGKKSIIRKRIVIYLIIMGIMFPFVFINRVEIYKTFLSDFDDEKTYYTEEGLPVTDYGYQNREYIGPHITVRAVSNKAVIYYSQMLEGNSTAAEYFNNTIDFIMDTKNVFDIQTENGTKTLCNWPYNFTIYGVPAGWVSGMADAKALHALSLAYKLYGDPAILDVINQSATTFETLQSDGGNLYILDDGTHWYPEIVIAPEITPNYVPPFILNGFLFVLHHIYQANLVFNNSRITNIFNLGVISAVQNIHLYDSPYNWSLYHIDYPLKLANRGYHEVHIKLCNYLYDYTNETTFKYYADKWDSYENPPLFTIEELLSPEFITNGLLMASIIFVPLLTIDILQTLIRRQMKKRKSEESG